MAPFSVGRYLPGLDSSWSGSCRGMPCRVRVVRGSVVCVRDIPRSSSNLEARGGLLQGRGIDEADSLWWPRRLVRIWQ